MNVGAVVVVERTRMIDCIVQVAATWCDADHSRVDSTVGRCSLVPGNVCDARAYDFWAPVQLRLK